MDIPSAANTSIILFGSTQLAVKVLGPTADYLGNEIKGFAEKRIEHLKKIAQAAVRKLGARLDQVGKVPVRTLGAVFREGGWAGDPLAVEYFGGILASSRSPNGRDDRGVCHAGCVGRLSSYQLRAHYIFYQSIKQAFNGNPADLGIGSCRERLHVHIPTDGFRISMALDTHEESILATLVQHVLNGLLREALIEDKFAFLETANDLSAHYDTKIAKGGFVITPSAYGIELFQSAYGASAAVAQDFLKTETVYEAFPGIILPREVAEAHPGLATRLRGSLD